MKTLSIAQGRTRLGHWLKKAVEGQDIAFAFEGHVVALRPVKIYSEDYALREYGATSGEMDQALAKAEREWKRDARRGKVKPFTP